MMYLISQIQTYWHYQMCVGLLIACNTMFILKVIYLLTRR